MIILGIETSCDETAAALIRNGKDILSNVVASSSEIHAKTGGIIPEAAARQQLISIMPVINEALVSGLNCKPNSRPPAIDAIAVTAGGPGLIGSMLVGVEVAKTLSILWKKPIVPVVHLLAHVYANWLMGKPYPKFPAIVLTVAGGHTDLFLMKGHGNFKWLGGTRDDAAGEAFDKAARLLNLPYPGGPSIQKEAEEGNPKKIPLPRPLINSKDYDFSFSGLKTAIQKEAKNNKGLNKKDFASSVQEAVADVLTYKTTNAAEKFKAKSILVAGGVAANKRLRELMHQRSRIPVFIPPVGLCTDNATFIASHAFFNYHPYDYSKIVAIPDAFEAIKVYGNFKN